MIALSPLCAIGRRTGAFQAHAPEPFDLVMKANNVRSSAMAALATLTVKSRADPHYASVRLMAPRLAGGSLALAVDVVRSPLCVGRAFTTGWLACTPKLSRRRAF